MAAACQCDEVSSPAPPTASIAVSYRRTVLKKQMGRQQSLYFQHSVSQVLGFEIGFLRSESGMLFHAQLSGSLIP